MRKILLFLSFILTVSFINAQTGDFDGIKSQIEKSDADIEHPKKGVKSATWDARGKIFLDAYTVNTAGLYVGMPQTGEYPSFGADVLVGEPNSKVTNDDGTETWVYDRVELIFDADKNLSSWNETQVVDEKALCKAYDAFKKAEELDTKGSYKEKSTTKDNISTLRRYYFNKGLDAYNKENLETALFGFTRALELWDYPRTDVDTILSPDYGIDAGTVAFYAGDFAYNLGKPEEAKEFYRKAVDYQYDEPDKCYHFIAMVEQEQGNDEEAYRVIEEAYRKYPKSLDILYDLINYYMDNDNTAGALEYIDKAVADAPNNASVYFAKGTLYDKLVTDSTITDEKKEKYNVEIYESYKKAIELDETFFAAYYNLGVFYYMKAKSIRDAAQDIPSSENEKYESEMAKAKEAFKEALPYMEKAHELDETDTTVMSTLVTIYLQLQMYTEQKEMKQKLESMN